MKNTLKVMLAMAMALCLFALSLLPAGALWDFSNGLPNGWQPQDSLEDIKATEVNETANPHASQEAQNLLYYLQMVGGSDQFIGGQFDISADNRAYQQVIDEYGYTPSLYSNHYRVTGEETYDPEPKWVMNGTEETTVLAADNEVMDFTGVDVSNALLKQHYDEGAVVLVHSDTVPRVVCRDQAIKNKPDAYTEENEGENAVWELDSTNPDRDMQTYALWLRYLENYAASLKKLEDSGVKAYLWRPWVENTGHKFCGTNDQGRQAMVRVFQQTVNYMVDAGLTGFLVTCSPAAHYNLLPFNPGTDYIDCYGFTLYPESELLGKFRRNDFGYQAYQVVQRSGKPLGFTEFSCRSAAWRSEDVQKKGRSSAFDLLRYTSTYWPELSWVNFWGNDSFTTTNDNNGRNGNDDGFLYWSSDQVLTLDETHDYRTGNYTAPGVAQLFATTNASDGYVGLEEGTYTAAQLIAAGVSPSGIRSIRVNRNFAVAMYTGDNCTGTAYYYTGSNKAITEDVAASFQSAKVYFLENLTAGKTATASTSSYTASNAIDGDVVASGSKPSVWRASFLLKDSHYLQVDLGANYDLKRFEFELYDYNSNAGSSRRTVSNFTLQTSVDEVTWKTVYTVAETELNDLRSSVMLIQHVEAGNARYVRLVADDNGNNGTLEVDEFRVFGTPSMELPVTALGAQIRTMRENDTCSLRLGFGLTATGVSYEDDSHNDGNYRRALTNPTITIDGNSYTLVDFGAVVSNNKSSILTLEDGTSQVVPAMNLYAVNSTAITYTAVVKTIPEQHWDSMVYARPYAVYKDGSAEKVIYGNTLARSVYGCEQSINPH